VGHNPAQNNGKKYSMAEEGVTEGMTQFQTRNAKNGAKKTGR